MGFCRLGDNLYLLKAEAMAPFAARLPTGTARPRLLGTSGTVTTLGSVHLGLTHYDRSRIDGLIVPTAAMREICIDLAGRSIADRGIAPACC